MGPCADQASFEGEFRVSVTEAPEGTAVVAAEITEAFLTCEEHSSDGEAGICFGLSFCAAPVDRSPVQNWFLVKTGLK